jgi:phosphoserine aminotransferase
MRGCNFSPGPAALPESVLQQAQIDLWDWQRSGFGVMETSHRSKDFVTLVQETESFLRALLAIPEHYAVLFLQGGATLQFSQIPLNWLKNGQADYLLTGLWSEKAFQEGLRYGRMRQVAEISEDYRSIPEVSTWQCDPQADYFHYCHNETVHGVEFMDIPQVAVPLISDFSSTLLSRPIDVSRFALIYAGAQKNIGPAGVTIVILDPTRLPEANPLTPTLLNYRTQMTAGSLANTPPTFALYVIHGVLQDLLAHGGLAAQAERNAQKAALLYQALDALPLYENRVDRRYRSWMNVPFFLKDSALDSQFLHEATALGLYHLKGHKQVGGMRASLYNAVSLACVEKLVDFLNYFAKSHAA